LLFIHFTHKTKAFARKSADKALTLTIVANSRSNRIDPGCDGRVRNDSSIPNYLEQVILGDNLITIPNQISKKIKDLGLNSHKIGSASQFPPVRIQSAIFEQVPQDYFRVVLGGCPRALQPLE
jgi:hypothetical protein